MTTTEPLPDHLTLRIARGHRDTSRLEIEDPTSGITFLRIDLNHTQLGQLLGTNSQVDQCPAQWRGLTNLGMERQHRSFVIPDLGAFWGAGFGDAMREAVKPYEVDGWVARIEVRRNNHRATPDKGYRVSFYRYVPPGTPDTHPKDDQQ